MSCTITEILHDIPELRFVVGYFGLVTFNRVRIADHQVSCTHQEKAYTYYVGTEKVICRATYYIEDGSTEWIKTRWDADEMGVFLEKIKKLGAKTTKSLPQGMAEREDETE